MICIGTTSIDVANPKALIEKVTDCEGENEDDSEIILEPTVTTITTGEMTKKTLLNIWRMDY